MTRALLASTLATLAICQTAIGRADPLHAIAQGAYQHHESGWIFPQRLAGFLRSGVPQDVDGSRDAVAYYARVDQSTRSTAVIDVYPKDSAAAQTLAQAQAAIERELRTSKKVLSRLRVSEQPSRVVTKVSYAATSLYFFDSGEWVVRIRISPAVLGARMLDEFVREQRWDSLGQSLAN